MPLTHRPIQIECFLWRTIAETVILITTVNIFFRAFNNRRWWTWSDFSVIMKKFTDNHFFLFCKKEKLSIEIWLIVEQKLRRKERNKNWFLYQINYQIEKLETSREKNGFLNFYVWEKNGFSFRLRDEIRLIDVRPRIKRDSHPLQGRNYWSQRLIKFHASNKAQHSRKPDNVINHCFSAHDSEHLCDIIHKMYESHPIISALESKS